MFALDALEPGAEASFCGYVMNKKLKSIPKFQSEAEERRFRQTHDFSDYIDWSKAARVRFPNLKPSTTAISLRLPVTFLERIKVAQLWQEAEITWSRSDVATGMSCPVPTLRNFTE